VQAFKADWQANLSLAELCCRWTITKDQVIRLRTLWQLPARHDRRMRSSSRHKDPTPAEIVERAAVVRQSWSVQTELDRRVVKPTRVELKPLTFGDQAFEVEEYPDAFS
jgi:hypothetical protein